MRDSISQVPSNMTNVALNTLCFEAGWNDVSHHSLAKVAALLWLHATVKVLTNLGRRYICLEPIMAIGSSYLGNFWKSAPVGLIGAHRSLWLGILRLMVI